MPAKKSVPKKKALRGRSVAYKNFHAREAPGTLQELLQAGMRKLGRPQQRFRSLSSLSQGDDAPMERIGINRHWSEKGLFCAQLVLYTAGGLCHPEWLHLDLKGCMGLS